MPSPDDTLFPIFSQLLPREAKEKRLQQRARVVWLFGLSGSGKSTLAVALERSLADKGYATCLLDGDNVRLGLNRGLGFSEADRTENLRRVAEVAKLFVNAGIVTLCSFITPSRAHRTLIRDIVGAADFIPVYVNASFETCSRRDPKGLYAKAAVGGVKQFTGQDSLFEAPVAEDGIFSISTENESEQGSLEHLLSYVEPRVRYGKTDQDICLDVKTS